MVYVIKNLKETYSKANFTKKFEDINIWHRRFGHLNIQSLLHLKNKEMVLDLKFNDKFSNEKM